MGGETNKLTLHCMCLSGRCSIRLSQSPNLADSILPEEPMQFLYRSRANIDVHGKGNFCRVSLKVVGLVQWVFNQM